MSKVHFTVAVWNRPYVDLFLNLSLPSQLSSGNLPAVSHYEGLTYKIYTTKDDEVYMRQHPAFEKLNRLIDTKIIAIDDVEQESKVENLDTKFANLTLFHNNAIKEADAENAALVFLFPDYVLADGTFPTLLKLRDAGYRAVLTLTLRLVRETAMPDLLDHFYSASDHTFKASPRELVKVGLNHLHPIEKTYFWGTKFTSFPIHAYWPVRDEGLIARGYYLHPLLIDPAIKGETCCITVDADYIDRACPNHCDIYVVRDSDELTCFELTGQAVEDANAAVNPSFKPTAKNYARWAVWHGNPVYTSLLHHWLFQVPVRVHTGNFSIIWKMVALSSKKTAKLVQFYSLLFRKHTGLVEALRFNNSTFINQRGLVPFQINLELTKSFVGSDWGEIDRNQHGEIWRWIGSDGNASVQLDLKPKCTYVLRTEIRRVIQGDPEDIQVMVNGELAENQKVFKRNGLLYHWCMLPKKNIEQRKGLTKIVYIAKKEDKPFQVGLSWVVCQPLRWDRVERMEQAIIDPLKRHLLSTKKIAHKYLEKFS